MSDAIIEEVPLEPLAAEPVTEENTVAEEAPAPKRGKGRPPGSKNRPKPAPPEPPPAAKTKPKPKASKKRTPVYEEDSEESSEEEQPPPKRRKRQPVAAPEVDRTQLAAEVLALLSETHAQRAAARRNNYRAWF